MDNYVPNWDVSIIDIPDVDQVYLCFTAYNDAVEEGTYESE